MESPTTPHILAIVGMSGSGKSEVAAYLKEKNIPVIRFGDLTDEGVQEMGLPLTTDNERLFRENIRKELGMAAYAIKAKPKIDTALGKSTVVALDGLYSWEEYIYLREQYPSLILIHVFAERQKRYDRLVRRSIRPVPQEKCYEKDVAELVALHKGGPIAIADYQIENNGDDMQELYRKVDALLVRLQQ